MFAFFGPGAAPAALLILLLTAAPILYMLATRPLLVVQSLPDAHSLLVIIVSWLYNLSWLHNFFWLYIFSWLHSLSWVRSLCCSIALGSNLFWLQSLVVANNLFHNFSYECIDWEIKPFMIFPLT